MMGGPRFQQQANCDTPPPVFPVLRRGAGLYDSSDLDHVANQIRSHANMHAHMYHAVIPFSSLDLDSVNSLIRVFVNVSLQLCSAAIARSNHEVSIRTKYTMIVPLIVKQQVFFFQI